MRRLLIGVTIVLSALLALAARAPSTGGAIPQTVETTVVLQQGLNGYTGCNDTHLYQYATSANYCNEDRFRVGYNLKQQYTSLLHFDAAPIPANATILDAKLELYAAGWGGSNMTLDAYRVLRAWIDCQATWNQAYSGNPWGQPGCNDTATDRSASPEDTVSTTGINQWYRFDLTQLVQGWVDGSVANNGILLRAASPWSISMFHFASAQNSTANLRPRLVVTYRTAVATPTAVHTPTNTPTPTATRTPTQTPTPIDSPTVTATPTQTLTPTASATPTNTPTVTQTPLNSATPTPFAIVIGHITDAHIGDSWVYSQRLPAVVSAISEQAQVMVDTGDCTGQGNYREYVQLVSGSASIPWRAVPGNHDIPPFFEQYIGPLEWSWDVGGYRLIGLNTEAINYTLLDQSLTDEKPCIVFGHFPLDWCTPTDQYALRQRFQAYDVPIYIAGHTHLDSLQTDPQTGTMLLTGQRAGLGHYRLVTLQGWDVTNVSFENAWESSLLWTANSLRTSVLDAQLRGFTDPTRLWLSVAGSSSETWWAPTAGSDSVLLPRYEWLDCLGASGPHLTGRCRPRWPLSVSALRFPSSS